MPQNIRDSLRVSWILFATAFAAGAVDIIGFARLGGVFASAMTGNFALLAYHVAQGNTLSAIGSVVALIGFVSGCLIGFTLRRGRPDRTTVSLLLGAETALLLVFAIYARWDVPTAFIPAMRLQILILAVAMGLQAALIASYLLGALLAGILAVHEIAAVMFLPLAGVAVAFVAHQFGGIPGASNPLSQRGSAASRRRAGEPE